MQTERQKKETKNRVTRDWKSPVIQDPKWEKKTPAESPAIPAITNRSGEG